MLLSHFHIFTQESVYDTELNVTNRFALLEAKCLGLIKENISLINILWGWGIEGCANFCN